MLARVPELPLCVVLAVSVVAVDFDEVPCVLLLEALPGASLYDAHKKHRQDIVSVMKLQHRRRAVNYSIHLETICNINMHAYQYRKQTKHRQTSASSTVLPLTWLSSH